MAGFGVGIGDIIAISALSLRVYRACSNAVKDYNETKAQLASLNACIAAIEKEFPDRHALESRADQVQRLELKDTLDKCKHVLEQIEDKFTRHARLGTVSRTKWDVIKFVRSDLTTTNAELSNLIHSVTIFISSLISHRLRRIENRLEDILKDAQAGRRDVSAIVNSKDEIGQSLAEAQWSLVEDELVRDGFDRNEVAFQREWFRQHAKTISEDGSSTCEENINEEAHQSNQEISQTGFRERVSLRTGRTLPTKNRPIIISPRLTGLRPSQTDVPFCGEGALPSANFAKKPRKEPWSHVSSYRDVQYSIANPSLPRTRRIYRNASAIIEDSKYSSQHQLSADSEFNASARACRGRVSLDSGFASMSLSSKSRAHTSLRSIRSLISEADDQDKRARSGSIAVIHETDSSTPELYRLSSLGPSSKGSASITHIISPACRCQLKIIEPYSNLLTCGDDCTLSVAHKLQSDQLSQERDTVVAMGLFNHRTSQLMQLVCALVSAQLIKADTIDYSEQAMEETDSHIAEISKGLNVASNNSKPVLQYIQPVARSRSRKRISLIPVRIKPRSTITDPEIY